MPVLKAYTDGRGHYIHASVHGAVVTLQITPTGVAKLENAGIASGERFDLRLLADLTKAGQAYTRRKSPDYYEAEQFTFGFFDESESDESESLFPACEATGSFEDLHLVVAGVDASARVQLLSCDARDALAEAIHLSIPISVLSPAVLAALEAGGHVSPDAEPIRRLRDWFMQDAHLEWERLRSFRSTQRGQFRLQLEGSLNL